MLRDRQLRKLTEFRQWSLPGRVFLHIKKIVQIIGQTFQWLNEFALALKLLLDKFTDLLHCFRGLFEEGR